MTRASIVCADETFQGYIGVGVTLGFLCHRGLCLVVTRLVALMWIKIWGPT